MEGMRKETENSLLDPKSPTSPCGLLMLSIPGVLASHP